MTDKEKEGVGITLDESIMGDVRAARRLDTLRMEALDYSLANGLKAAKEKYPTLTQFLSDWQGKSAKDYIRSEVAGGLEAIQRS